MFNFVIKMNPLFQISPIDGRYHSQTQVLENYFQSSPLLNID